MRTIKIDKRGKILIPHYIRKELGLFPGQKMRVDYHIRGDYQREDKIVIIPFGYKCKWCGADIPEGDKHSSCEECNRKNTIRVY